MTGLFRTSLRAAWIFCLAFHLSARAQSGPAPRGPGAPASPPPAAAPAPDSSDRKAPGDSLDRSRVPADDPSAGSARKARRKPPVYRWHGPDPGEACAEPAGSLSACWRRNPLLANQDIGFPGARAWTLSLTRMEPAPWQSAFFPAWRQSPYLSGGLIPPERFALRESGGDVIGLEEIWTPVVPLDTPVTRLEWERGALSLNAFQLKLRRMLSDRVYLGLDYYSASGDSQAYDYQFNVHQPYLGGLGFLGQLYPPLDRDSLSLVIEDNSHSIDAMNFRPRVGFWMDSNHVAELFLDRVGNTTSLTFPRGPASGPGGAANLVSPGRADSVQFLMPADFSSYTEGVIYSWWKPAWTAQWEAAYTFLEKSVSGGGDSLTGFSGADRQTGEIIRSRGIWAGTGLPLRPSLRGEVSSENREGRFIMRHGPVKHGWSDREAVEARLNPRWGGLELDADAGVARESRMDNQVFWLPGYGASARLDLPWGFGMRAGAASREEDPDWETLHRYNPALRLYPNPALQPRSDLSARGSLSWTSSLLSLEAGADFRRIGDTWLPKVLPGPDACAALKDSVYRRPAGAFCTVPTGSSLVGTLPDSLALPLRNYREEERDYWHLGMGLNLGNWSLRLHNRFLLSSRVADADLDRAQANWQVPERVFKGQLGWKRDLMDNRLKVKVGWDWEWFSSRYAWVPDLRGGSRVIKLDEYLALDFLAGMHIKSFLLYFKAMNLNHDRYAAEPGVHPPGLNFRFGIDWMLRN